MCICSKPTHKMTRKLPTALPRRALSTLLATAGPARSDVRLLPLRATFLAIEHLGFTSLYPGVKCPF